MAVAADTILERRREMTTLEEAVAYGLANSTSIRARELAVGAAQLDLAAARAGYYPSLSAGLSYTHLFEVPSSPLGYATGADPIGLSLDVGQTIYSFGKIGAGDRGHLVISNECRPGPALVLGVDAEDALAGDLRGRPAVQLCSAK